ncbi:MAG: lectin-like protein [Tepidisphaeraceae bacterium]
MRKRQGIILATLTATLCPRAQAVPIDGPITDPANGNQYYLLSSDTWNGSEAQAVALGGTLATVQNLAENSWIQNTFGPLVGDGGSSLWIGFYDPIPNDGTGAQHAADFIWASGAPVTYTNWAFGEASITRIYK